MPGLKSFGRWWWPVLVIVAVTIAVRFPFYGDPAPSFDEQLYNLIGHHMLLGSWPYVDLWDRKPIGLFLIYAFTNLVADHTGLSSPLSYELLATLFGIAGGLMTWRLAEKLKPGAPAMAAGAFYPLLMARFGSQAGQSEGFFVPLMIGALVLIEKASRTADRRRALSLCLLAMFVCGIALQVKYTVAMQCGFLGLASLWILYKRGYSMAQLGGIALLFAAAGIVPTIAAWVPYALAGHSQEFVFANFVSIFDRGSPPESKIQRLLPYLWLPATCILLGLSSLLDRREKPSPTYLLYAGWTISCAAGLFMGSTIYAYYLAALVPGALLMALPVLGQLGSVSLLVLLAGFVLAYDIPGRLEFSLRGRATLERLTTLIKPHIGKDRCLYVYDGPSWIYDSTGSCLPTRFIYPDHLNNVLERNSLGIDQVAEVHRIFAHNPPGVVVTADRPVTAQNKQSNAAVKQELDRAYRDLASVPYNGRTLILHVRKDDPVVTPPAEQP
ncbi:MAG: hypothetical protein J7496_00045 [Novosphingobium sp.]|nr:hypothetical protein [Novosphingobium sp.]